MVSNLFKTLMDSPYLSYNKSMGELKLTNGNISFIFNLKEGRYHIENENGTIKALFPSVNVYRNFDNTRNRKEKKHKQKHTRKIIEYRPIGYNHRNKSIIGIDLKEVEDLAEIIEYRMIEDEFGRGHELKIKLNFLDNSLATLLEREGTLNSDQNQIFIIRGELVVKIYPAINSGKSDMEGQINKNESNYLRGKEDIINDRENITDDGLDDNSRSNKKKKNKKKDKGYSKLARTEDKSKSKSKTKVQAKNEKKIDKILKIMGSKKSKYENIIKSELSEYLETRTEVTTELSEERPKVKKDILTLGLKLIDYHIISLSDINKTKPNMVPPMETDNNGSNYQRKLYIHSSAPLTADDQSKWRLYGVYKPYVTSVTFLENGYQSWSVSKLLSYGQKSRHVPLKWARIILENQDMAIRTRYNSEMISAINDRASDLSIVLGFITNNNCYTRILMDRLLPNGNFSYLTCLSQLEGKDLNDPKSFDEGLKRGEELFISLPKISLGHAELKRWAELTAIRMNSRVIDNDYYNNIGNLKEINSARASPASKLSPLKKEIDENNNSNNNSNNTDNNNGNNNENSKDEVSVQKDIDLKKNANTKIALDDFVFKIKADIKPLSGWCSWYYYYLKIDQDEMIKNINFLKEHDDLNIDIIQLDDGYEKDVGDFFEVNDKFPDGLKFLVDKIHAQGKIAGLWIAPFFAKESSSLFKDHPDWFLRNSKGKLIKTSYNWKGFLYGLDLSKPEVLDYIKRLIDKIINKWGFDYIKIDFIYASEPLNAIYSDPSVTRARVLRKGVETIRRTMGINDSSKILLGCGAPLGPCVGLVDVMRIGNDTAASWLGSKTFGDFAQNKLNFAIPALKPALLATIMRSYMHKSLWINDPDCVVVRKDNSNLTYNEILLQITIFGLSGGQIFFSDDLAKLSNERLNLMKILIPPSGHGALPLDILINYPPHFYGLILDITIGKTEIPKAPRILLSVINWKSSAISKSVQISWLIRKLSYYPQETMQFFNNNEQLFFIYDFWKGRADTRDFSEAHKGAMGFYTREDFIKFDRIEPHACRYISIIPILTSKDHKIIPTFVSSDFHILQGEAEVNYFNYDLDNAEISIEFNTSIVQGERTGSIKLLIPLDSDKKLLRKTFNDRIKITSMERALFIALKIELPKDKYIKIKYK